MGNSHESRVLPVEAPQEECTLSEARPTFVITLCALAAPLIVPQPRSGELKNFKFFIHRETMNGRESLKLAMGFFTTRAEAERWLLALRGTYPHAFVDTFNVVREADPEPPEMAAEDVVRVLEVRFPTRVAQSTAIEMSTPLPERASTPAAKPSRAPEAQPRKRGSLEETLDDLAALAFSLDSDDTGSTTGVRHLRVEVDRKSKSAGPAKSRRR